MTNNWTSKPMGGGTTDRPGGIFLDSTGNPTLAVAICGRCNFKFFAHQLRPDPNAPGLMVCEADRDVYDPYRLPARSPDKINLPFVRSDVSLSPGPLADSGILVFVNASGQALNFVSALGGFVFVNNEGL